MFKRIDALVDGNLPKEQFFRSRHTAWHFTDTVLRDGKPLPRVGEVLSVEGDVIPCFNGLHGSFSLDDVKNWYLIPHGTVYLHMVTIWGGCEYRHDKLCGRNRVIHYSFDVKQLYERFKEKAVSQGVLSRQSDEFVYRNLEQALRENRTKLLVVEAMKELLTEDGYDESFWNDWTW